MQSPYKVRRSLCKVLHACSHLLSPACSRRVDFAYLDASHERGETLLEVHLYWSLLRPGGVLAGDDYQLFPAVSHDVDAFARCHGVRVQRVRGSGETWMLRKPEREDASERAMRRKVFGEARAPSEIKQLQELKQRVMRERRAAATGA